jgi:hypothetical protein
MGTDQQTDKLWRQILATNFGDKFCQRTLATNVGNKFWRLFFTLATLATLATFFALKVIWGPTNGPTDQPSFKHILILATNFGDKFW